MTTDRYTLGLLLIVGMAAACGLGALLGGQSSLASVADQAPMGPAAVPGLATAGEPAVELPLIAEPPLPPPWQQAPAPVPAEGDPILRGLHEIARTVTCMVDGELVKDLVTERAEEKAFIADPRDQWAASDNWDYDHEAFIRLKQTLQRAACLAPGAVSCNLFKPAALRPDKWYFAINDLHGGSQVRPDGDMIAGTPGPEMLEVYRTGKRVEVTKVPENYSVLTPVYDSMGRIVAVVEVFTRTQQYNKPRE